MKPKQLWIVIAFMLLSVTFSASGILAAEDVPELKVEKVKVTAYDKVIVDKDDTEFDIIETLEIEDKIFLRVDMYMSPKWTETAKRANINSKEIVLVGEDDVPIEMAGYFKYTIFYHSKTSFDAYRPHNWDKVEPSPFRYNAVFIVPKDSKAFTFQLGSDISARVEVPAVQPLPDPRFLFTMKLEKIKFSEKLSRELHVGGERRKVSVVPEHTKFLEIKLTAMPSAPNTQDQKSFYLNVPWFGLVYDNGHYATVIGDKQSTGKLSKTKNYSMKMKEGKWEPKEITVCFAVPEDIKDFTLTYLKTPVIEGTIGEDGSVEAKEIAPPGDERKVEEMVEESSPELIKKVQSLLTLVGYDPGPADGKLGAKTITAIKAFQKDAGLMEDGKVTEDLLKALKERI